MNLFISLFVLLFMKGSVAKILCIPGRNISGISLFSCKTCHGKWLFMLAVSLYKAERTCKNVCIKEKQKSRAVCSLETVKDTLSANLHAFKNSLKF